MNPVTLEVNYTLANNIDLGLDLANPSSMWSSAGFVPIANRKVGFTGSLEGRGHTISNLAVGNQRFGEGGLFADIGAGGVVRDLALVGGSVSGTELVGALVAVNSGVVDNVTSSVAVTGAFDIGGLIGGLDVAAVVANSSATGTVSAPDGESVGGLIGESRGSVVNSFATGSVTAAGGEFVGGLIGNTVGGNAATVTYSFATGVVYAPSDTPDFTNGFNVGGLIGDNQAKLLDVYATGKCDRRPQRRRRPARIERAQLVERRRHGHQRLRHGCRARYRRPIHRQRKHDDRRIDRRERGHRSERLRDRRRDGRRHHRRPDRRERGQATNVYATGLVVQRRAPTRPMAPSSRSGPWRARASV